MERTSFKRRLFVSSLLAGFTASVGVGVAAEQDDVVRTAPNAGVVSALNAIGAAPPPQTTQSPGSGSAVDEEDDERREEEVEITGSRIRTLGNSQVLSLPVDIVSREQIETRAFDNVLDALAESPFIAIGSSTAGGNVQNGDSFSFSDVLGCGSQRTLTLVNGRRFVSSNQATVFVPGNDTGSQVDLNLISPLIVEQTETVPGGGGPIYGADAVCGVINIKTIDDFDGIRGTAQGNISQFGDSGDFRAALLVGKSFFGGRTNVSAAFDYVNEQVIDVDANRDFLLIDGLANPFDFGVRADADIVGSTDVASIVPGAPGAIAKSFLALGSNETFNSLPFFGSGSPNFAFGGQIATAQTIGALPTAAQLLPDGPVGLGIAGTSAAALAQCGQPFTCFAPTGLPAGVTAAAVIAALAPGVAPPLGLTPTQFAIQLLQANRPSPREFFADNPGLDPLLFLGTFRVTATGASAPGGLTFVANTNPATSAFLPRLAVPLQFNNAGQIVPFNFGQIDPLSPLTPVNSIGSDGPDFTLLGNQLRAGQERHNGNLFIRHDITDNITYKGEFLASSIEANNVGAPLTNGVTGALTGSGQATAIRPDNAFLSAENLADLAAVGIVPGSAVDTSGRPLPFFFLNRVLDDITGFSPSFTNSFTLRTAHGVDGTFDLFNRSFDWGVDFAWGRVRTRNVNTAINDIAFALATDAVIDPASGQAVCRSTIAGFPSGGLLQAADQVTIDLPGIDANGDGDFDDPGDRPNTPLGATVTAQDLEDFPEINPGACSPLNLFGSGSPSPEAIDFVLETQTTTNTSNLFYGAVRFGGEIIKLPAGPFAFNAQVEWRREENAFIPEAEALLGLRRAAPLLETVGSTRTVEGGFEGQLPIFGEDFNFIGLRSLTLNGAVRVVNQSISGTSTTFTGGAVWSPIRGITLAGSRARSVRSPSVVESQGAPQSAFFGAGAGPAFHPCDVDNIDDDQPGLPAGTRLANCTALVESLGIPAALGVSAADFLSTFQAEAIAIPALIGPNPFLGFETGNIWQAGINIQPTFIPRLNIQVDYFDVTITDAITLGNILVLTNGCFDNVDFPATPDFPSPLCEFLEFESPTTPEGGTNPVGFEPGRALQFNLIGVPNLNLATQDLDQLISNVTYSFGLNSVLDPLGVNVFGWDLGTLNLRGQVVYIRNQADSTSALAEPGEAPRFTTRLDATYQRGRFSTQLQWFRSSGTVDDLASIGDPEDQGFAFINPAFNSFNLSSSFRVTDNFTARFIVNNITGVGGNVGNFARAGGRTFVVALSANF